VSNTHQHAFVGSDHDGRYVASVHPLEQDGRAAQPGASHGRRECPSGGPTPARPLAPAVADTARLAACRCNVCKPRFPRPTCPSGRISTGSEVERLVGTRQGKAYEFAGNQFNDRELSGPCFSPQRRHLLCQRLRSGADNRRLVTVCRMASKARSRLRRRDSVRASLPSQRWERVLLAVRALFGRFRPEWDGPRRGACSPDREAPSRDTSYPDRPGRRRRNPW
jgi:hypothetical protein